MYSLNSFVTVFERAIGLVSGDKDPMAATATGALEDGAVPDESTLEDSVASGGGAPTSAGESKGEGGKQPASARRALSDEELAQRCVILQDSTTRVTFSYLN